MRQPSLQTHHSGLSACSQACTTHRPAQRLSASGPVGHKQDASRLRAACGAGMSARLEQLHVCVKQVTLRHVDALCADLVHQLQDAGHDCCLVNLLPRKPSGRACRTPAACVRAWLWSLNSRLEVLSFSTCGAQRASGSRTFAEQQAHARCGPAPSRRAGSSLRARARSSESLGLREQWQAKVKACVGLELQAARACHDGLRDNVHSVFDGLDDLGGGHIRHLRATELTMRAHETAGAAGSLRHTPHGIAPAAPGPPSACTTEREQARGKPRPWPCDGPLTAAERRRPARAPTRARGRALRPPSSAASCLWRSACQRSAERFGACEHLQVPPPQRPPLSGGRSWRAQVARASAPGAR